MLVREGWLSRVRRGLYLVLPLEASAGAGATPEDPWVLAREVYTPCYIGGWSAAEHWGLTEQIFRSIFVVTAANIRARTATLSGVEFVLARVSASRLKALTTVWRGPERVQVSDRERTIVDALVNPAWVGGIRHLAEMVTTYKESPEASLTKLTGVLQSSGNGAAAKRFGYLAEQLWPAGVSRLKQRVTGGVIKLDPAVATRGKLNKDWGLWINVTVSGENRQS